METSIEQGDYVTHKDIILNGGLQMSVVDVNETQAKVSYVNKDGIIKEDWFDFNKLILLNKCRGGFIDL